MIVVNSYLYVATNGGLFRSNGTTTEVLFNEGANSDNINKGIYAEGTNPVNGLSSFFEGEVLKVECGVMGFALRINSNHGGMPYHNSTLRSPNSSLLHIIFISTRGFADYRAGVYR
jgi:hypothetical protein